MYVYGQLPAIKNLLLYYYNVAYLFAIANNKKKCTYMFLNFNAVIVECMLNKYQLHLHHYDSTRWIDSHPDRIPGIAVCNR